MNLQLLLSVNILLVGTLISGTFGDGASQDIVIYPLSTYKCDDVENLIDGDITIRAKNDYGDKIANADIDFDFDLTEEWEYVIKLDQWSNGDWDENIFNANGKVCDILNQYMRKVWEKLGQELEPNLPGGCGVPKGHYKLNNFEVLRDEYDIPATMFGKFRYTGTLIDESGTDIWCHVMEVQVDRS